MKEIPEKLNRIEFNEDEFLAMQRAELKKFLRLSMERDLYNFTQASFRLNISRNRFQSEFIDSGLLKPVYIHGEYFITRLDINKLIESKERSVSDKLRRVI